MAAARGVGAALHAVRDQAVARGDLRFATGMVGLGSEAHGVMPRGV